MTTGEKMSDRHRDGAKRALRSIRSARHVLMMLDGYAVTEEEREDVRALAAGLLDLAGRIEERLEADDRVLSPGMIPPHAKP